MKYIEFDSSKKYDLILLGRIAVDLNPVDYYCPLKESTTFKRYLGASAYEYHGLIALFGCTFYNVVFKRHFRIKSRPMSPKPRIRYVFALAAPIIINFSEIFVYMYPFRSHRRG